MLAESRRIAALLLTQPSDAEWDHALKIENILQKNTPATAFRQAKLIRNRLVTLDEEGWKLIAEGDMEVSSQLLLAAAIKHSYLLGDFLRDVYARQLSRMELALNSHLWDAFWVECVHRDGDIEQWSASTRKKLFEVIVRILVEAKYLDSSRKKNICNLFLIAHYSHSCLTCFFKQFIHLRDDYSFSLKYHGTNACGCYCLECF